MMLQHDAWFKEGWKTAETAQESKTKTQAPSERPSKILFYLALTAVRTE